MVRLSRRPIDLVVDDLDAAREWVFARVEEEIFGKGQPLPKFILLGSDFAEILDLSSTLGPNPEASAGATFRSLRSRPHIRRRFIVVQVLGVDPVTSAERKFALVIEELDDPHRWFLAQIQYTTDAAPALGRRSGPGSGRRCLTSPISVRSSLSSPALNPARRRWPSSLRARSTPRTSS